LVASPCPTALYRRIFRHEIPECFRWSHFGRAPKVRRGRDDVGFASPPSEVVVAAQTSSARGPQAIVDRAGRVRHRRLLVVGHSPGPFTAGAGSYQEVYL
jgi:hypothetical protein